MTEKTSPERFMAVRAEVLYEGEYDNHEVEVVLASEHDAVVQAMRDAYRPAVLHFKERAKTELENAQRLERLERERDEVRAALAVRGKQDAETLVSLRVELEEAKAENERLTEIAEHHEAELAFWKPGLAAWRLLTAPTPADLEALADVVMIVETPSAMDVARNVLAAIADRARAPEHEPARSTEGT